MTLDRQAQCPSCGAPMTFRFGGARAQVCAYCRFVVARTDRGLQPIGRMADLLELPSPLAVGRGGWWGPRRFEVEGRAQYDRVGVASAPWQEFLLGFPEDGTHGWVASAQGRWYVTSEVAPQGIPPVESLGPGMPVALGSYGTWTVQEIGHRRLVSAEGHLTGIPQPDRVTRFVDISGPEGRFGTIDYGDGAESPQLFLGYAFDPAAIRLDSGAPLEAPRATVRHVQCPTCGGNLPLLSERSERVVCSFCGTQSDVTHGHLEALGPTPRPPVPPIVPIGAEGMLRGVKVVCCGFVVRSCIVEGERYAWHEYLLWAGPSLGYWWLTDEDGRWSLVTPLDVGALTDAGSVVWLRDVAYAFHQEVVATVDHVVGEFHWKVAVGERVEAAEFQSASHKVSRERTDGEVVYSFGEPLDPSELAAFGIEPPRANVFSGSSGSGSGCGTVVVIVGLLLLLLILTAIDDCGVGPVLGGGTFSK